MNKWVREVREKGNEMKIGYGRAKIKGIWRSWESIKIEIEIEKERRKEREEEEEGGIEERKEVGGEDRE